MSSTASAFKFLYEHNRLQIGALRQAVMNMAITEEDYKIITGEDYDNGMD